MNAEEAMYWKSRWLNSDIPPQPVPDSLKGIVPEQPVKVSKWERFRKWWRNITESKKYKV